jgi:hypothetical protein
MLANSDDNTFVDSELPASDGREENYQRLSASINDLFANLLKELDKQKNKEYLMNNVDELLNTAKLTNFLMMSTGKASQAPQVRATNNKASLQEEQEEIEMNAEVEKTNLNHSHHRKSKNNNNSNDSNKDSGFNQESFYNNMGSPESSNKNNHSNSNTQSGEGSIRCTNLKPSNSLNNMHAQNGNVKPTDTQNNSPKSSSPSNNDHQEMSLLERYLNSEQIIAYKHTQIEVLLHKWFVEQNRLVIDDDYYSIIEYILNQEGISLKTFVKLIKEKFSSIEWHNELLVDLYDIVNYDQKATEATAASEADLEKSAKIKSAANKLDYQDSIPDGHFYKVNFFLTHHK